VRLAWLPPHLFSDIFIYVIKLAQVGIAAVECVPALGNFKLATLENTNERVTLNCEQMSTVLVLVPGTEYSVCDKTSAGHVALKRVT
jgi:hypothetical protein